MDKLILNELTINKFRALKNVDLKFTERHNEITGANGMGKSSILDCIRFMMTDRDELNSKLHNFKTITKTNEEEFPNVELKIKFKNKDFHLKTLDNQWFINGNKLNSRTAYLNAIENLLGVKQEQLVFSINPNILKTILSGNKETKNKDKIRSTIVGVANSLSDKDDQVMSQNDYEQLSNNIENLGNDIKGLNSDIRSAERRIQNFKRENNEIKDWNSPDKINDLNKEEEKLKNQKKQYSDISDDIYKKQSQLKDLKNKKIELENAGNYNNELENSKPEPIKEQRDTPSAGEKTFLILSSCLIVGVFYSIYLYRKYVVKPNKNPKSNNDINKTNKANKSNANKENIDRIQNDINKLDKEIKDLQNNPNYKNVNVNKIVDRLNEIQNLKNNNIDIKMHKKKMDDLQEELEQLKALKAKKEKELDKKNHQKKAVAEKTNQVMKKYFHNFQIDFFDENDNEILKVSKDNIPLDYLNYSEKMNSIFEINSFLNKRLSFSTFVLIDAGESFNKVYDSKNQIIITKVTTDHKLKLNGKDAH